LSAAGKIERVDQITNYPILMTKGDSKLALYGMGSVREERLHRTFEADGVQWAKPQQDPAGWFNIAVVHQNRSDATAARWKLHPSKILLLRLGTHGFALFSFLWSGRSTRHTQTQRDYLPEKFLPSWLDMVVWSVARFSFGSEQQQV